MVRVDTLLLAKYGIFQPTTRHAPGSMTINNHLHELTPEDKADLVEFAQFVVMQHELDEPVRGGDHMSAAYAMACRSDMDDFDDEGVLFDEA